MTLGSANAEGGPDGKTLQQSRDFPNGLHVDTFHPPRRYVTALLYLTNVTEGGSTAFPLTSVSAGSASPMPGLRVEEERAVRAAQTLLDAGTEHTQEIVRIFPRSDAAAIAVGCLEARAKDTSLGLSVQPVAGDVLLFFTRCGENGSCDARSWHGGTAVLQGCKRTMQNFMEPPTGLTPGDEAGIVSEHSKAAIKSASFECSCTTRCVRIQGLF